MSQEGDKFEVTKKVAVQSELVKTMAEGDKEENEIPLPNVKASVLKKVVEYMRYHVDNPARTSRSLSSRPTWSKSSANGTQVTHSTTTTPPHRPPPPPLDLLLCPSNIDYPPMISSPSLTTTSL